MVNTERNTSHRLLLWSRIWGINCALNKISLTSFSLLQTESVMVFHQHATDLVFVSSALLVHLNKFVRPVETCSLPRSHPRSHPSSPVGESVVVAPLSPRQKISGPALFLFSPRYVCLLLLVINTPESPFGLNSKTNSHTSRGLLSGWLGSNKCIPCAPTALTGTMALWYGCSKTEPELEGTHLSLCCSRLVHPGGISLSPIVDTHPQITAADHGRPSSHTLAQWGYDCLISKLYAEVHSPMQFEGLLVVGKW